MTSIADQHYRTMVKTIRNLAGNQRMFDIFRDFVELFALATRNAVNHSQWQKHEDRYLEIAGKYTRDQLDSMAEVFALVVQQMEVEPSDVLGRLYMELEISNEAGGQFFTPYEIAKLMAAMQAGEIAERGDEFTTIYEPACGAGAFMIAISQELRRLGREFHVTAEDIDPVAVHMAYLQFTLLDIPAVVYHRDTLTQETYDAWHTPAHVLGLWSYLLRRRQAPSPAPMPSVETDHEPAPMPEVNTPELPAVSMPSPDLSTAEQGAFDFVVEGALP